MTREGFLERMRGAEDYIKEGGCVCISLCGPNSFDCHSVFEDNVDELFYDLYRNVQPSSRLYSAFWLRLTPDEYASGDDRIEKRLHYLHAFRDLCLEMEWYKEIK